MKTWTVEEIKVLLEKNDVVVCRSLMQMYECQTDDEKMYKETSHDNGIGFNAFDSKYLSSLAEFYNEYHYLSNKQIAIARKKLMKYSKQIVKLANEHEHKKATEHDLKNFND